MDQKQEEREKKPACETLDKVDASTLITACQAGSCQRYNQHAKRGRALALKSTHEAVERTE